MALGCATWRQDGPKMANLEPKTANLAPFWGTHLDHFLVILGAILQKLAEPQKHKVFQGAGWASWELFSLTLALCWLILPLCWAMLEHLGQNLAYLRRSWAQVATFLAKCSDKDGEDEPR